MADEKACSRCGAVKPLSEFPRDARRLDGHRAECAPCKRRLTNPEWAKKTRHKDMARHVAQRRAWEQRNPEKFVAQRAVRNAVRDGRLAKPNCCEECGVMGLLHGHHEDYARPLEVRWLCPACHKTLHVTLAAARTGDQ